MSNPEIVDFVQDAAIKRGINPWIACAVASSEGGLGIWNAHGHFDTGDSYWPLQLHYGGPPYSGTTPGMGNGFTALTGWQPGDIGAGRDSVRYALNRAKRSGWGAWYGAAGLGLVGYEGIDRNAPWDANSELWDFEKGHASSPTLGDAGVKYDVNFPAFAQNDPWSCGPTSLRWALWSVGRKPSEQWIESQMIAENIANPDEGIHDATGAGIAAFVIEQYGEYGYGAVAENPVEWDYIIRMASGKYPLLIGGRAWGHWSGVRQYDGQTGVLLLANPAEGWQGVGQTMNVQQFERLGPFSCVRILHNDLILG